MAKFETPTMRRLMRKKRYNATGVSSPGREAWKRLRKNKAALAGLEKRRRQQEQIDEGAE